MVTDTIRHKHGARESFAHQRRMWSNARNRAVDGSSAVDRGKGSLAAADGSFSSDLWLQAGAAFSFALKLRFRSAKCSKGNNTGFSLKPARSKQVGVTVTELDPPVPLSLRPATTPRVRVPQGLEAAVNRRVQFTRSGQSPKPTGSLYRVAV